MEVRPQARPIGVPTRLAAASEHGTYDGKFGAGQKLANGLFSFFPLQRIHVR